MCARATITDNSRGKALVSAKNGHRKNTRQNVQHQLIEDKGRRDYKTQVTQNNTDSLRTNDGTHHDQTNKTYPTCRSATKQHSRYTKRHRMFRADNCDTTTKESCDKTSCQRRSEIHKDKQKVPQELLRQNRRSMQNYETTSKTNGYRKQDKSNDKKHHENVQGQQLQPRAAKSTKK